MPEDKVTELSESAPTEPEAERPELYTEEWYHKVNKQFEDLGEFIRSGKATHDAPTEPESTPAPSASSEGQPASDETADGTVSAGALTRDTRPPKSNHFWFRRLGE